MPQTLPIGGGFDEGSGEIGGGAATTYFAGLEYDVLDFEVTTPPGSPSSGDTYTVGHRATGLWLGWDGALAIYTGSAWRRKACVRGMRAFKASTGEWCAFNGTHWLTSYGIGVARAGIVASATQTQGQVPLGHALNRIATVATTNDAVTLPPAMTGRTVTVANDGANTMKAFPDVGDAIDAGGANAATTSRASRATHRPSA